MIWALWILVITWKLETCVKCEKKGKLGGKKKEREMGGPVDEGRPLNLFITYALVYLCTNICISD